MEKELKEMLEKKIKEKFNMESVISYQYVKKLNGVKMYAVYVILKGSSVSPIFYIDELLKELRNPDFTVEDIADRIIDLLELELKKSSMYDFSTNCIIENKDNVYIQVVNYNANSHMFDDIVYEKYLDLAIVFRLVVKRCEDCSFSTLISNKLLIELGMTKEELLSKAIENTKKEDYNAVPIERICFGVNQEEPINYDIPNMYVLGYKALYGSSCMYTLDGIRELAMETNNNLYIIPSSINEIIAIPTYDFIEISDVIDTIGYCNGNFLDKKEYLSSNLYKYDILKDCIEIVDTHNLHSL